MDTPSMVLAPGPLALSAAPSGSSWYVMAALAWAVYLGLILWALKRRSSLWQLSFTLYNRLCRWCVIRWETRPSRVAKGLLVTADYLARMTAPGTVGRRQDKPGE